MSTHSLIQLSLDVSVSDNDSSASIGKPHPQKPKARTRLLPQTPRRRYTTDEVNLKELVDGAMKQQQERSVMTRPQPIKYKGLRFATIATVQGLMFLPFSILQSFFPQVGADKGMTPFLVGFTFGIYQLTAALAMPLTSSYAYKIGLRFTMISGVFIVSVATLLFSILQWCPAGAAFSSLVLILRVFMALGSTMVQTIVYSIATEWYRHRLGFAYGVVEICMATGTMGGSSLGGVLYDIGGFYFPFVITGAAFTIIAIPMAYLFVPSGESIRPGADRNQVTSTSGGMRGYVRLLALPRMWPIIFISSMGGIGTIGIQPLISPAFQAAGVETYTTISIILLFGSVVYSGVSFLVAQIGDCMSRNIILTVMSALLATLGYALLGPFILFGWAPGSSVVYLTTSYLVVCAGNGCVVLTVAKEFKTAAVLSGMPDDGETNAQIAGLYTASFFCGGFLGPTVLTPLSDSVGFHWTMAVLAIAFLFVFGAAVINLIFSVPEEQLAEKESELTKAGIPTLSRQSSRFANNSVVHSSVYGGMFIHTTSNYGND